MGNILEVCSLISFFERAMKLLIWFSVVVPWGPFCHNIIKAVCQGMQLDEVPVLQFLSIICHICKYLNIVLVRVSNVGSPRYLHTFRMSPNFLNSSRPAAILSSVCTSKPRSKSNMEKLRKQHISCHPSWSFCWMTLYAAKTTTWGNVQFGNKAVYF